MFDIVCSCPTQSLWQVRSWQRSSWLRNGRPQLTRSLSFASCALASGAEACQHSWQKCFPTVGWMWWSWSLLSLKQPSPWALLHILGSMSTWTMVPSLCIRPCTALAVHWQELEHRSKQFGASRVCENMSTSLEMHLHTLQDTHGAS